ncbi:nuclear transport factor 2 family protein [Alkalinema pantanalense CENA528]|uniref:nuclear transport factor 2 family protein n=1 Tax=Alkalinema pantanalense TaxID=1620705 RepID=UPI003D6DE935
MTLSSVSPNHTIDLKITGIQEPVIYSYFNRLNQGDFQGVSELFAPDGCLYAPFESGICGREAIEQYLEAEAQGMTAFPRSGILETSPDNDPRYKLMGIVKTSFFTVNVGWTIEINPEKQITSVTVKLLAELQELLGLQRH